MDRFIWGKIKETHRIGEHEIIEFYPYKRVAGMYTRETEQRILFSVETGRSHTRHYESLDHALIGSLAAKYDGQDTQADKFIALMLRIPF